MNKSHLLFLLFPLITYAQMPTAGNYPAAPDDWLLGNGQKWHYRAAASKEPTKLTLRAPFGDEIPFINRAKELLKNSSAKTIALIDGNDLVWVGYKSPATSNSLFLSFSVGKTVTSMAIGQAICAGKLSLFDRADVFVSELKGTALGSATVQQLLKMSSGTAAINGDTSIMSAEQERDMRSGKISFLDILKTEKVSGAYKGLFGGKRKSGEVFDYHTTDPLLLGIILNNATGTTYAKWVEQMVLHPAGISHDAVIGQDHFDFGQAEGNIRLTLEDWARFAIWVKSTENGSNCFSNYVREASKTQITNSTKREGKAFDGYGYLIWTENNRLKDSYWAAGYGGQRIAWNHKNNRIAIAFSNVENYGDEFYRFYSDWASLKN
jgi:CubicO group peptidase (beta-lactamase class C family)